MPKFLNNINLAGNELQNAVIQVASDKPQQPKLGQIFFDSDTGQLCICTVGYTTEVTEVWEGVVTEVEDGANQFNTALKIGRDSQNLIDFATTDNKIIFRVNDVDELELVENALQPTTTDGIALGTSGLMWSDLFLASGSVINFNNSDMTLTHSSNTLTVVGGTLATEALTTSTIVASGAVTVGVDAAGHDVKFYGATTGKYMEWDSSADQLNIQGDLTVQGNVNLAQGDIVGGRSKNYATSIGWTPTASGESWVNQTGYFGGSFTRNGEAIENSVVWGIDPFGGRSLIWTTIAAENPEVSDADGGWNKNITIPLNNDMGYLSYVYIRRNDSSLGSTGGGTTSGYLGCHGDGGGSGTGETLNVSSNASINGTVNENPYFDAPPYESLPVGVWCCIIGVIQAYTDANTSSALGGGVYRMDTGQKIHNSTTFKMAENAVEQMHRAYFYYSTNDASVSFWNPGFHAKDGSEPRLNELLGRRIVGGLDTDIKVGRDAHNLIDFTTDDQITFRVGDTDGVVMKASGVIEATSLDISGGIDVDGTSNLDAVDIDGTTQIDGTVTVGVDDTGYDVKFFGATASKYMEWDESADRLKVAGGMIITEPDLGGAPANTAILHMHGYENRGVGLMMKGYVNSASGSTEAEWFAGTGYQQEGFSIGYASDGLDTSYVAQNKFSLSTGGNAVIAGTLGSGAITSTGLITGTSLDINGAADITGIVTIDATGTSTLILNGDSNDTDDTGQLDSTIQMLHDAGQYGILLETRNYTGKSSFEIKDKAAGTETSRFLIDVDGHVSIGASGAGCDLTLLSDSSVFAMGAGSDITLTHDGSTGGTLASAGNFIVNSTAGSLEVGTNLANGQTLKLGPASATQMVFTPSATAGDEKISLINTSGSADDAIKLDSVAGGILIDAGSTNNAAIDIKSAGGIDITSAGATKNIDITSTGGRILLLATENTANAIYLRANGGISETVKIHSDQGTGAGSIELTSDAGGIDINAGTAIDIDASGAITMNADGALTIDSGTSIGIGVGVDKPVSIDSTTFALAASSTVAIDGTGVSIDGTLDSNLTVAGSGQDLDINITGGGTQQLRLASAGTDGSALKLTASAGSVDIDAGDNITMDAADLITLTTADTGVDGKISLVSGVAGAHTAIHLDGNADPDSIVDIDAGVLDIDVTGAATLDAATSWTVNSPLTRFMSSTSAKPVVEIRNSNSDADGAGKIQFVKDKGATAGADGDLIGQIYFNADDDTQPEPASTSFAKIKATVNTAANDSESGKLELYVATADGTTGSTSLDAGLTLTGSSITADEVNVTIGKGPASVVTTAGDLVVTGDLTVGGTTTTVNSTTVDVADININLGNGVGNDAEVDTGGITLEAINTGVASNKTWNWINATDSWTSNQHIDIVSSGTDYKIAGTSVLNATTLGSAVVTSSLTTVGTIGSGTWQGTDVGVEHGGTGVSTLTSNAVLVGNGASAITSSANLSFDDTDLSLAGAGKMEFRDDALYINSSADSQLDIVSNSIIELTAPTVTISVPAAATNPYSVLNVHNIIGNNPLRLHAGESYAFSSMGTSGTNLQTGEKIYCNAESGMEINSSPSNWDGSGSLGQTNQQKWDARHTATICDTSGNSTFPGDVTLTGELDAATGDFSGIIDVGGVATVASLVCTAEATFGGGYGDTGATISDAGVGTFNGALTTDGVLTGNSLVCTTAAYFGGGYASGGSGATITTDGIGVFNGALTTYGALTGNSLVCTNAATFGGGFGYTGATISDAGVGQFDGALTSGGTITATNDFIASDTGLNTAPAVDVAYYSGYGIMGNRSAAVYLTNTHASGAVTIGNGGVHGGNGVTSATFSPSAISLKRPTSVIGAFDSDTSVTVGSTVVTDDSIVMTPSTGDTFTIASTTNGATSLTTVDADGEAAHITVVADGNVDIDGLVVTLDAGTSIQLGGDTTVTGDLNVTGALTNGNFGIATTSSWVLSDSTNGVASSDDIAYTITHGMGTSLKYGVEVIRIANGTTPIPTGSTVEVDIVRTTGDTIVVTFATAVTAADYCALVTKFPV